MKQLILPAFCVALLAIVASSSTTRCLAANERPNILLAISDDQSWAHTSIGGYRAIQTPSFDRVARAGVLFSNCVAASPGCAPSRASLLTGRHHWQNEHAGTHASSFAAKYVTYPELLEQAGYFIGYTGKPWGPGKWQVGGRTRNPAGPAFSQKKTKPPYKGISSTDYAANFQQFLDERPQGKPFCFWYGAHEPHRGFEKGAGLKAGKKLADVVVPPFLPDTPEIRSDILDYCVEIEWFDRHLGQILDLLQQRGELENTLVIVTADNGMAFPRAKANMYEYGIHMPLAISWPRRVPKGRVVEDLVGFVDLAPTMLAAAGSPAKGAKAEYPMSGRSCLETLVSERQGRVDPTRTMAFSGRERHSSSRHNNLGYPTRALRTHELLYIRNFHPERWPAGDPQKFDAPGKLGPMHGGYHDIDACPSLSFLIEHRDDPAIKRFFHLSVDKRPAEELFDIVRDPGCLKNLAADPAYAEQTSQLRQTMEKYLTETGDPRMGDNPEIWESYPRYSHIREFPPSP